MSRADQLRAGRHFAGTIAICLALWAGTGCGRHQAGHVESNRYTALGEVMAMKLNELTGGEGSVVLVVGESDNNNNNQPTAMGLAIAAFRNTLSKSVSISATETVAMPAVPPPGFEPLSADKFAKLLQKHEGAGYLVSFVGVPVLTPAQIDLLPSRRPQAVAVVTFRPPTKAMFANKVVCLAAVPRFGTNEAPPGSSAQEQFDAQYQLVTPETMGTLPR